VVTSTTTNPNEELENYICNMNESTSGSATPPVHIEFESFIPPVNRLTAYNSRSQHLSPHTTEQLIVYAAPIIQSQLLSRYKETAERLKELKKEKSTLITAINKPLSKHHQQQQQQQRDDPQQ
jgi:hypothetical protein